MPLVRFEVKNEYGLGQPELYRGANREDPKAVLDGVAVAGLVGILRQLGDLSEFAAEVFHGLQEQVMSTASRSHKLMVRVQNIEAALPSLEKAVLAQTSHIHLAYTAGSEWQPHTKIEQNHFIYNDLPRFIMDSYEECHDPPRLQLLDKFDTGGPGSCLRRYSDPTFFRRMSGDSSELDVEKVQKVKKTRKNRKNKPSQRNGDLHYAPMQNNSSRVHLTDTNINGRTSPSHTASTNDITQNCDHGDHSNSFDLRNGSGFDECVFHINSDVLAGEQESKESFSSFMLHNNIHDSDFPDGKSSVSDDHSLHTLTPAHVVPGSSNVTWDEKAEIVNPKGQHSDAHETPDMVVEDVDIETEDAHENPEVVTKDFDIETDVAHETPMVVAKCFDRENEIAHQSVGMVMKDFDIETENQISFDLTDPDQLDMVIDDVNTSGFINNLLDEVESEPENYMDALNTIESESENDVECPKRHEAEKFPSNTKNGANNEKQEVEAHILDQYPVMHEYDTRSGVSLLDSKDFPAEQTPPLIIRPSSSDHVPDIVGSAGGDALDSSKTESVVTDPSSCGSVVSNICQEPPAGDEANSSSRTQESQAELHRVNSVTFWTNGGLLGLQPSKPPDFAVSKAANHDNMNRSNGVAVNSPGPTVIPGNHEERGKLERFAKDCGSIEMDTSSKYSSLWQTDQHVKVQHSGSHLSNQSSHDIMGGLEVTSSVTPLDEVPVNTNAKSMSNESNHHADEDSSQIYGFSRRLLANGFYRKMPLVIDSKPQNSSSERKNASEQMGGLHNIAFQATPAKALEMQFERKPYIDMVTSSPPLEHMKISFHPIDSFEASKLKLKFPDASHNNESTRDMFASFQLVPEPAIQLHDDGLISDDDTFCRSSPYESDDGLGHHSESDSEQWESGESPENKDNELYDDWCRISPGESILSSLQHVEIGYDAVYLDRGPGLQYENGAEPSVSASCLDLPSFETLNPVVPQGEGRDGFDKINKLDVQNLRESTPSPPPLPPVQWCVTKLHSDVSDDRQHTTSAHEFSFDPVILQPIRSQQEKPPTANEHHSNKESITVKLKSREQDEQKLNPQEEAKHHANDKGMDEKEDFLQKIRSKSFSLRRTVTTRPTFPSGSTTNDKVTAILVKANAIRQAVGSDDGEDDDSWSDT